MHSQNVFHGALSAQNVKIELSADNSLDFIVKLANYGELDQTFSLCASNWSTTLVGTCLYKQIKCLFEKEANTEEASLKTRKKLDYFALGCLLTELMCRKRKFDLKQVIENFKVHESLELFIQNLKICELASCHDLANFVRLLYL